MRLPIRRHMGAMGGKIITRLIGRLTAEIARSVDNHGAAALEFAAPSFAGIRDCLVKIIPNVFPTIDEPRSLNPRNVYFSRKNVCRRTILRLLYDHYYEYMYLSHFDAYLTTTPSWWLPSTFLTPCCLWNGYSIHDIYPRWWILNVHVVSSRDC